MTSLTRPPAPLEAYLRRATLGLPAQQREEVWNELEEHVLCRAEQLEFQGQSPEQALKQALRELGPPLRVSAAMNGVHNMPKLIAFGTVGILAVSAGLYALAGGGSQAVTVTIPALASSPEIPACVKEKVPASAIVNIVSQKDGITCFTPKNQGAFVGLMDLKRAYDAAGLETHFDARGNLRVTYRNGEWRSLSPRFTVNGQGYTSANMLIVNNVRQSLMPELKLSGYDNPLLSFGTLKLRLGTEKQPVAGSNFYLSLLGTLIGVLTATNLENGWEASWQGINHLGPATTVHPRVTVQTGLKPGEVVMLVTPAHRQAPGRNTTYFADIAQVEESGTATLFTRGQPLNFVGNIEQLKAAPTDGKNHAVLVKITGINLRDLKSGIFLPK